MSVREVLDWPEGQPPPSGSAEPAFEVRRPAGPPTPFVFASPHSGRLYPTDMKPALDEAAIRRSEDAFVDALASAGPRYGAPLIVARYARAYIDVNREAYELDQAMFEDELPAFAQGRSPRVAAGLGSIARVVAEGQEIYARKLTFAEASRRIDTVHTPYHAALAGLLDEAKAAHGYAILIDWHSMPAAAAAAGARGRGCDFVLGDRFGAACSGAVAGVVERELEAMGYATARNAPYAGGHTTEFYGRPAQGVHALQIEINRALYLNERTLKRHGGFDRLARDLERLVQTLTAADWSKLA
ncbi:MAG: N-formylglutamate amidohydrolase [Caulobacterales bacterium 32-69-10]|nr:MAG: N-formylglutamate amidohydrolase [Caulobacterales bacterium 32-69-10]